MKSVSSTFFQFAGIHSFLIGMLPFFIPVLLLQRGVTIEGIALFIAVTGLSFIVSLKVWQQLYNRREWQLIISASFVVELMLVEGRLSRSRYLAAEPLYDFSLETYQIGFAYRHSHSSMSKK